MNQPPMNRSPSGLAPDSQSLEEILARTWARRAEQARLASAQTPVPPADPERPRVGEPDAFPTQTGHGPDAEATADLADESAAHPSPAANGNARFTGGLPNEDSKAARAILTDEIKAFIVKGLACYDTPSQVAQAVNLEFGITVSRQRVNRYKPDGPKPPAQRWRELHAATRQALLRELADIGVAHPTVRLRRLDRLANRSETNDITTTLKCLEMAAKECGGMYETRRRAIMVRQAPMPLPSSPREAPE